MRYISWLITLPLTALVLMFALLNRQTVTVTFSPIHDAVDMPLYVAGLLLLVIGYICGAAMVWLHSSKIRWKRYQETRRADRLEKEMERQKNELDKIRAEKESQNPPAVVSSKPAGYIGG